MNCPHWSLFLQWQTGTVCAVRWAKGPAALCSSGVCTKHPGGLRFAAWDHGYFTDLSADLWTLESHCSVICNLGLGYLSRMSVYFVGNTALPSWQLSHFYMDALHLSLHCCMWSVIWKFCIFIVFTECHQIKCCFLGVCLWFKDYIQSDTRCDSEAEVMLMACHPEQLYI